MKKSTVLSIGAVIVAAGAVIYNELKNKEPKSVDSWVITPDSDDCFEYVEFAKDLDRSDLCPYMIRAAKHAILSTCGVITTQPQDWHLDKDSTGSSRMCVLTHKDGWRLDVTCQYDDDEITIDLLR